MKNIQFKTVILLSAMLFSTSIFAQNNNSDTTITPKDGYFGSTLFSKNNKLARGFYGNLGLGYTSLNGMNAFASSFKAELVIGHSFGLGFEAGQSITYPQSYTDTTSISYTNGYAGLVFEPIFFSSKLVSVSVPITVGGGSYNKMTFYDDEYHFDKEHHFDKEDFFNERTDRNYLLTSYFNLSGGLEVDLHVFKWFKVGLGAYYNYRYEMQDKKVFDSDPLNNLRFGVNFKFGRF